MKPEFFKDELLWDLGVETGLPVHQAFQGLWCFSDREGRFEWRPRALKTDILPYWDGDFDAVLEALASKSFIVRYTVEGRDYGLVRNLAKHQVFNHREPKSELPPPELHGYARACPGVPDSTRGEWKGRERELEGKGEGTDRARVVLPAPDDLTEPVSYTRVPSDWRPSDAFYGEAQLAGVTRAVLDEDVTYWRSRKLGGEFVDIEMFFRSHFTRLAKRRETEAFKQPKHGSAQPNAGKTGWEHLETKS